MVAHVFDCSNYLFAGGSYARHTVSMLVQQGNGPYKSLSMNVSGITYLFNEIVEYEADDVDLVFAFDSPPKVKRAMYGELFGDYYGYKAGRAEKPLWIDPCSGLAREALQQMGYNVLYKEDYEADDVIATFVKYHVHDYSHIYLHTRDSDLVFLVGPSVTIEPCNRQGKHIDVSNYEAVIDKDTFVKYNTNVMYRMCFHKKDNVPLVPKEFREKINRGIPSDVWPHCGNLPLLRYWINKITDNNPVCLGIFDLVTPIILPAEDVELYESSINKDFRDYYFYKFGVNSYKMAQVAEHPDAYETILRWVTDYAERGGR